GFVLIGPDKLPYMAGNTSQMFRSRRDLAQNAGVVELTAVLRGERVRKFAEHLPADGGRVGVGEVTTPPTLPRSHRALTVQPLSVSVGLPRSRVNLKAS